MASMSQQRRRQQRLRGGAPQPDSSTGQGGNRRIYDPRRWHKSSHGGSNASGASNVPIRGQPPAGWVLVWAGRFKRWRRRWFVAHPPGLLLYYKTSDQIGRPGCISLLGANVAPVLGKDRQFKIAKGSVVYYLRTINREFRQAWVDTIRESISTYNKSVQKAQVGVRPGSTLFPQNQALPPHIREEWEEQEKELNRRVHARLQELEPAQHAFLQQLQSLQRSLSAISGALGFTSGPMKKSTSANNVTDHAGTHGPVTGESRGPENHRKQVSSPEGSRLENGHISPRRSDTADAHVTSGSREKAGQRSIFRPWRGDSDGNRQRETTSLMTSRSGPTVPTPSDAKDRKQRRRSLSFSVHDTPRHQEYLCLHQQGSCFCATCAKRQQKSENQQTIGLNGHFSDSEVARESVDGISTRPGLSTIVSSDSELGSNSVSRDINDSIVSSFVKDGIQAKEGEGLNQVGVSKPETSAAKGFESKGTERDVFAFLPRCSVEQEGTKHRVEVETEECHGPIQATWNSLIDAFSEVLREEIHRVLELEAENAVLQESLAMLPELQRDRMALTRLKDQLKRDPRLVAGKGKIPTDNDGEDGDDEEDGDGDETEDDASIVASELTNEEYFEALEVLNQYEFMAKATPSAEQEGIAESADGAVEPPEEGDTLVDADNLSEAETEELNTARMRLPAPRPLNRGFSLWTVLKNAIGKDLNRITMPATINEPLSVLQRSAEEMQYRDLLEIASQEKDSLERLLWVSAFACSTYHGSIHRDAKPFNPMLGETYEWLAPDGRAWFLAEQVSHHPPIMAFQAESKPGDYVVYGEIEIRNKFWGKSVEIIPTGLCHLRFQKHGDHFTWNKLTTCVHNVVVGKLWIDNYGELVVRNHATGEHSRVRFHKATSRERCRISGKVYDAAGVPRLSLYGSYMDTIYGSSEPTATPGRSSEDVRCLWKSPEAPEDFHEQYCFTTFAIGLNELTPKLAEALPPTDSRLRSDQRGLEDGDLEKATPEKLRLEEKQRRAQKLRKDRGEEWRPLWFRQRVPGVWQVRTINDGEEPSWVYQQKYWEAREKRAWEICPDIM